MCKRNGGEPSRSKLRNPHGIGANRHEALRLGANAEALRAGKGEGGESYSAVVMRDIKRGRERERKRGVLLRSGLRNFMNVSSVGASGLPMLMNVSAFDST